METIADNTNQITKQQTTGSVGSNKINSHQAEPITIDSGDKENVYRQSEESKLSTGQIDSTSNQTEATENTASLTDSVQTVQNPEDESQMNIRVAMLGNVDSGKSTLSGVLTSQPGTVDDGRGLMRSRVFNFQHEQNNGRTSSVAQEIVGFKEDGEQFVTKLSHTSKKNKIWPDIAQNSKKIVHLLDMCGHEKYLKTTMHGLTSLYPDYCLLAIGANMGVSKMTKEHIGISWALDLPMFVVFTKVDLAPKDIFDQNMKKISKLMRQNCNKIPVQMKTSADIEKAKEAIGTGKVCPIFTVSNVTGEGVDLLRQFLAMLPKSIVREQNINLQKQNGPSDENNDHEDIKEGESSNPTQTDVTTKFIIDSRYYAKGVGLVLGGTVLKGKITLDQQLMFGPCRNGNFKPVIVKGIHENRMSILEAGEMASICVNVKVIGKNTEPIKNNHVRKGSCLINPLVQKQKGQNQYQNLCVKYFDAHIKVLHHATTIKDGYQGVLHIGGVRQTVQAVSVKESNPMRTGDSGVIRFKFKYGVEYIEKNAKVMIREGNTKAFGFIKQVYPMNSPPKDLVDKFAENDSKVGVIATGTA